jgi:hypothetical protein
VVVTLGCIGCGPVAPSCTDREGRGDTDFNALKVQCSSVGLRLQCESEAYITGLYVYCPKSENVTSSAIWTVGDAGVIRLSAPGLFEASGASGDTFVRASWQNIDSATMPISVFAGTPFQTFEIFGSIYEAGKTIDTGAINGATIQIMNGLVAGRSSTSGVPPPLLPGYYGSGNGGRGYYRLLGVPPGTYRVQVSKDGYATQEREITITNDGSSLGDFQLQLK